MAEIGISSSSDDKLLNLDYSADVLDPLSSPVYEQGDGQLSISASLSSVNSLTSSVLAQLKLDDDFLLESKDLMVRVDNPEKHSSAIESYITFRVITKTTRSDFDTHAYSVRRRYNDFIWLRNKLEDTYPTHIIPPLPEKHSLQRLNRFNLEFVKTRMSALQKFLTRVADHPVLSFDKRLTLFLTCKPFEFTAHKKEGVGILGRVSGAFQNIAATYMMKSRTPEFEQTTGYIQLFGEKLFHMQRISQRINKEQEEHCNELKEFHPVFTLWSSSETQLGRALVAMASAVERCSIAQQDVVENYESDYGHVIREYILYADAIKGALKRRDTLQIEYELTVDELNNRKLEREQLCNSDQQFSIGTLMGRNTDDFKREKQDKVDQLIDSLTRQVECNNDKVECGNANLRSDFEHWRSLKNADLKSMCIAWADRQIGFYQKCLSAWEDAILLIRDSDCDLESFVTED